MKTIDVILDTREIVDWESFHDACKQTFGFPDFYGRNMDAWIDCMSYLEDGDGMTKFQLNLNGSFSIQILDSESFRSRSPEIFGAIVDCTPSVNQRYIERGSAIRISIAFL